MMGRREQGQGQFFYDFHLDAVVPPEHLVRQIDAVLDHRIKMQIARTIAWPARGSRLNPAKAQAAKAKLINKDINHPNRIVFPNVLIKPFGK